MILSTGLRPTELGFSGLNWTQANGTQDLQPLCCLEMGQAEILKGLYSHPRPVADRNQILLYYANSTEISKKKKEREKKKKNMRKQPVMNTKGNK